MSQMHRLLLPTLAAAQLLVPPKKMVFRTRDPLTNTTSTSWRKALSIDGFPTFMGVAEAHEKADDDVLAAMRWFIVPETGVVLLNPLVPLHYIYRHQHNAVVGSVWSRHHNQFAHLVATHAPSGHILEIGGGHGYLAAKLLFSEAVKHWTMVDPNPVSTFAIPDLDIVKSYVEDLGKLPHEIDCVVHSHTLEHMYDPARFFEIVRGLLSEGQLHIFSVPNLFALVNDGQPSLHFEHTILLREEHIQWLLESKGFEIVTKQYFGGTHSIFYVTKAVERKTIGPPPNFYHENKRAFQRWHQRIFEDAALFKGRLAEDKSRNFIFAAHVATQYLLAAGLPSDRFAAVLDNNQDKIGKRLYGHDLFVRAPAAIKGIDRPVVVLRTGVYDDEIASQLVAVNPGVVILRASRNATIT